MSSTSRILRAKHVEVGLGHALRVTRALHTEPDDVARLRRIDVADAGRELGQRLVIDAQHAAAREVGRLAVAAFAIGRDGREGHLLQGARKRPSNERVLDEPPGAARSRQGVPLDLDEVGRGGESHPALEVQVELAHFGAGGMGFNDLEVRHGLRPAERAREQTAG